MAAKFEIYQDSSSQYRWRLKFGNGLIIATSGESYANRAGVRNGIEAVQRDAAQAPIEDVFS